MILKETHSRKLQTRCGFLQWIPPWRGREIRTVLLGSAFTRADGHLNPSNAAKSAKEPRLACQLFSKQLVSVVLLPGKGGRLAYASQPLMGLLNTRSWEILLYFKETVCIPLLSLSLSSSIMSRATADLHSWWLDTIKNTQMPPGTASHITPSTFQ